MFRTTFYFLILIYTCTPIFGQENLIVNGSFEEYTSCPTGNDLGDGQFQKCVGWWYSNPSGIGTPDYFNRCSNGIVGIPNNFWGYQEAYDGDGYVGILPAQWLINNGIVTGKEIIQSKLKMHLNPCKSYELKMKISLSNLSNYSLSKIEVAFSEDSLFHDNLSEITSIYLNKIELDLVDIDTMEWFTVTREISVSKPFNYISIGFFSDFKNSNDTLFEFQSSTFSVFGVPYYFLDKLELKQLVDNFTPCILDLPNTFSPNNDGINDFYDLKVYLDVFDIYILNRWGNTVFELTDFSTAWDGTSKNGQPCADGVYYYYVRDKETKENIKSGFIHLFR